ncbi:MAG: hypothetical protein QOH74_61, partial [Gaiellales bacterium]|nr:hypothetical protein [Gaiellales bacterium]
MSEAAGALEQRSLSRTGRARVLVKERISEAGLQLLREQ